MALAHLTVAGAVEFALTVGVVTYLQRANLPLLRLNHRALVADASVPAETRAHRAPDPADAAGAAGLRDRCAVHAAGSARPRAAPSARTHRTASTCTGTTCRRCRTGWRATPGSGITRCFAGYGFDHDAHPAVGYIVSALVGMAAVVAVAFGIVALRVSRSDRPLDEHAGVDDRARDPVRRCACCGKRAKGDFVEKTIAGGGRALRAGDVLLRPRGGGRLPATRRPAGEGRGNGRAPGRRGARCATSRRWSASTRRRCCSRRVSRVPLRALVRRVWCFVPLFTGFVALPATLNVITPGHIVVPLGIVVRHSRRAHHPGADRRRAHRAPRRDLDLARRPPHRHDAVAAPSGRAAALVRSARFVLVLGLAYRYLFHLLSSITEMYEARKARASARSRRRTGSGVRRRDRGRRVRQGPRALRGRVPRDGGAGLHAARRPRSIVAASPAPTCSRSVRLPVCAIIVIGSGPCRRPLTSLVVDDAHYRYLDRFVALEGVVAHRRRGRDAWRCSARTAAGSRRC